MTKQNDTKDALACFYVFTMSTGIQGPQKPEVSGLLKEELHVVVSYLMWRLGTELVSSPAAVRPLTWHSIAPAPSEPHSNSPSKLYRTDFKRKSGGQLQGQEYLSPRWGQNWPIQSVSFTLCLILDV